MSPSARATLLRRLGLAMVVAALVAGLNLAVNTGADAQQQQDPQLVARGNDLYVNQCAQCHGTTGLGKPWPAPDGGPPLVNVGAASVDFMLESGRMPADSGADPLRRGEPAFDETDIAALVAYVTSLSIPEDLTAEELAERGIATEPGPDIPSVDNWETTDLADGRALFTSNCAACHGPTAAGVAVGQRDVSSNLDGVPPLQVAEAVRTGPGVMPVFSSQVLDQQDLLSIVGWVNNLGDRDSPGGISIGRSGPVSEGFVAWIVGALFLGAAIYLLGERIGTTDPVFARGTATTDGSDDDADPDGSDDDADPDGEREGGSE